MYACIYCDPEFSCTRVYIQPEVVQEVLADLKILKIWSQQLSWTQIEHCQVGEHWVNGLGIVLNFTSVAVSIIVASFLSRSHVMRVMTWSSSNFWLIKSEGFFFILYHTIYSMISTPWRRPALRRRMRLSILVLLLLASIIFVVTTLLVEGRTPYSLFLNSYNSYCKRSS